MRDRAYVREKEWGPALLTFHGQIWWRFASGASLNEKGGAGQAVPVYVQVCHARQGPQLCRDGASEPVPGHVEVAQRREAPKPGR